MFSSTAISPGFICSIRFSTLTPIGSPIKSISLPINSDSRRAIGRRLKLFGICPPLSKNGSGLPRCPIIMHFALCARRYWMVPRSSWSRKSSSIVPSFLMGTFRLDRTKTLFPRISKSLMVFIPLEISFVIQYFHHEIILAVILNF